MYFFLPPDFSTRFEGDEGDKNICNGLNNRYLNNCFVLLTLHAILTKNLFPKRGNINHKLHSLW